MGHFGFSYVGLIYLLMLFVPNIIWTKHSPKGYEDISKNENKIFLIFERVGQVLVTVTVLIFSDFNVSMQGIWTLWLLISFAVMVLYDVLWIRYFKSNHTLNDFYKSFFIIPVPLATLPVTAFLLLGIYGQVIWLIIATVILGIGHIGIHLMHRKEIEKM